MKAALVALLVFVTACNCSGDKLREALRCGEPCYPGPEELEGVGACHRGRLECQNDGKTVCVGYGEPSPETCDGVDNDCNGATDEHLIQECSSACGIGSETCQAGHWVGCNAPIPQPEVCNGHDDNCDGATDGSHELPVEFCYSRDPSELHYGECSPGFVRCEYGRKICTGEQGPEPETCNGKDEDCDGLVDEGVTTVNSTDIVFAIDYSGSMRDEIEAVRSASRNWASKYKERADLRFGLVGVPGPDQNGRVIVLQPLTDAATLATALDRHHPAPINLEPTYDAVYLLSDPDDGLGVGWKEGTQRIVVLFTDEAGQSYLNPPVSEKTAATTARDHGVIVHIFAPTELSVYYDEIPAESGGKLMPLTTNPSTIEQALDEAILTAACQ